MVAKTPRLLTAEQRDAFVRIPADLSERDLGRFYTLSARDLQVIDHHRRPACRLTCNVHGRTSTCDCALHRDRSAQAGAGLDQPRYALLIRHSEATVEGVQPRSEITLSDGTILLLQESPDSLNLGRA